MNDAYKLHMKYPDIIDLDFIGLTLQNRDILSVRLGKGSKKILFVGAHHAREYITSSYLMFMIQEYAEAYCNKNYEFADYNINFLLNEVSFFIIPMLNPDGIEIALGKTPPPFKVVHKKASTWKANAAGVDLNRNYPCCFKIQSDTQPYPCSEGYKGTYALSEPETYSLVKFCSVHNFELAASFHTKGEEIFFADENSPLVTQNSKMLAEKLSKVTGYSLMPISDINHLAGFENWFRARFSRPCLLIELAPYDNSPVPYYPKAIFSDIWKKTKYIGLCFAEFAISSPPKFST